MIGQSLSNTNETCYSVQIAKICNLNQAYVTDLRGFSQASRISIISFFFLKKNILVGLSFKKEKISSRSIKKERKITGARFFMCFVS